MEQIFLVKWYCTSKHKKIIQSDGSASLMFCKIYSTKVFRNVGDSVKKKQNIGDNFYGTRDNFKPLKQQHYSNNY